MSNFIYITYDGLLEPLGRSQVLSYMLKLSHKHTITIISYEKADDFKNKKLVKQITVELEQAGIHWYPLRYHKAPSSIATAFDLTMGVFTISRVVYKYDIDFIHARSYVAAMVALMSKKIFKTSFIFDMRGFWPDERIDGGIWKKNSYIYCLAKSFERKLLLSADHVVSLTQSGVNAMNEFSYLKQQPPAFSVITTCTDLKFFDYRRFPKKSSGKTFTLGYVGSAGVWYLFNETLECFKLLLTLKPQAQLRILNKGEHGFIKQKLSEHKINPRLVTLINADRDQVANEMSQMDAGIFFIKPVYSKKASAPTKLGEFLGCGTPCISNTGVGDMAEIIESHRVGVTVSDFKSANLLQGLADLLILCQQTEIQKRCRRAAHLHFSLEDGVERYDDIYNALSISEFG